jgi:hypothetical protein
MVQTALSSAFHAELQGIQHKLQTFFTTKGVPNSCFQLLDRLSVEHSQKFKQIISNKKIRTNVLAAIGRVTAGAGADTSKALDKDVFVTDGKLYRVKSNCNIEPVISSEHRRYFEIHTMRGTIPINLKPNLNEGLRLIANAVLCNRKPQLTPVTHRQQILIWIMGDNTQSFVSAFKTIAGGYALHVAKTDTKIKPSLGARVAVIENCRTLQTKLNRIPSTVFPLVVSVPNDLTAPDCGPDWLICKYNPPEIGLTPEKLFSDLVQAANPAQTEVTHAVQCTTSEQLANDSIEGVVQEFIKQHDWEATTSSNRQRKTIPIKDIKTDLSSMASKRGIKCFTQKSIAQAFLSNDFPVTNPRNVISVTYW